jgi:hypothetical protein
MKRFKWVMTGTLVFCCAGLAMAQERPAARQGQPVDEAQFSAMMRRFGEAYSRGDTEAARQIAQRIRGAVQGAPEVRREVPASQPPEPPQARERVPQQVPPAGGGVECPCPMAQQMRQRARQQAQRRAMRGPQAAQAPGRAMAAPRGAAPRQGVPEASMVEAFIRELRQAHAAGDRARVRELMQSARGPLQERQPPARMGQPAPGRAAMREARGRRR